MAADEDLAEPARQQILVVDDEEPTRVLIRRILERHGFRALLAADAAEARALLRGPEIALLICKLDAGTDSSVSLISEARLSHPDIAVLIASGRDDASSADAATAQGAYGYLVKPFGEGQLVVAVDNALRHRRLERQARIYQVELERAVDYRTAQLRAAVRNLRESRDQTIRALARAVEARNGETGAHIARIGATTGFIAERLALEPSSVELIRTAAVMHDVGKIAIPDRILLKPGPLTPEERLEIERHPVIGSDLLSGIGTELLDMAAMIALSHHEWFDGSGYPRSLHGDAIPLEGRIVAVADVFDALTSDRVYRPAFSIDRAIEMMRGERDRHFDPAVLDILLSSVAEIIALAGRVIAARPEMPFLSVVP